MKKDMCQEHLHWYQGRERGAENISQSHTERYTGLLLFRTVTQLQSMNLWDP